MRSIFAIAILLLAFQQPAEAQTSQAEPEPGTTATETSFADVEPVRGTSQMVVTANSHASRAADAILDKGGSAVDAAIAAQMVLTLVEPQSSGIGGGAFLLHFDAENRLVGTYDGRETTPALSGEDRFLDDEGVPIPWPEAVFSGSSVGVPGITAMLEEAHKGHGALPWADLFQPAIDLARTGFEVSPRLNGLLTRFGPDAFFPAARDYFFDDQGAPRPVGFVLKNEPLAETLGLIAQKGGDAFYLGDVAKDIVDAVQNAPRRPGDMTLLDLADYVAKRRPAVCGPFRGRTVCGMGPPSSGGLTVIQALGLVGRTSVSPAYSASGLHRLAEAQKLAFADRNRFIADNDFVAVPDLLNSGYVASRRQLIDPEQAIERAEPGNPPALPEPVGVDGSAESPGTTHISIVDQNGNAVSMTSSIESAFGSRLMVRGFLLNNQLTDFSFRPKDEDGTPIANRVQPKKRPRSSMAPTIVFAPDNNVEMVVGSPGGSRIIPYVIKGIVGHLDWGLNAQAIASSPNFGSRNGPFEIEEGFEGEPYIAELETKGQTIRASGMTSGLNIIIRRGPASLEGGTDPRREGLVIAD
ncbi:MAG: gamma-glutamyltransferase [Pseudomonadota bacterium]